MTGPTQDTAQGSARQAEEFLHRGEPLLAYNQAQAGLQRWPGDARLRQLQALALARSGDVERANAILRTLADEGRQDAETLGILARYPLGDLDGPAAEPGSRQSRREGRTSAPSLARPRTRLLRIGRRLVGRPRTSRRRARRT